MYIKLYTKNAEVKKYFSDNVYDTIKIVQEEITKEDLKE